MTKQKPTRPEVVKRAAIYIRVSTEKQAEKASPQEQEKDCREYCERQGYVVAEVYRDTERYRVGRKMVEPSGTRNDRPQLRRMLADASTGTVDVIVAWREDRLYRGTRPMLDVLECIEANKKDVELVRETFDRKMAPIKAAIARMELDAIKERHSLGRAARMATGKACPGGNNLAYGYRRGDEGYAEVEPTEAEWVVQINEWYADGVPLKEIRRRLILANAPQRGHPSREKGKRRIDWAHVIIQRITRYEPYRTGKQIVKMYTGKVFEIPMPVLINADLARRVDERRAKSQAHPARHKKYNYLVGGLAYCERCGVKLQAKSRIRPHGVELSYTCKYHDIGYVTGNVDCCKYIAAHKLDSLVWDKVWSVINDDELFLLRIQARVDALQKKEIDAEAELERMQKTLDDLATERQKVILWTRKGSITESDMELQLGGLALEEMSLKGQMQEMSLLVGDRAQRLIDFANRYRARLRLGAEFLTRTPTSEEEAEEQFKLRHEIVDAIVRRVEVRPDKTPVVYLEFDLEDVKAEVREALDISIQSNG